jgi:hypothetical protein
MNISIPGVAVIGKKKVTEAGAEATFTGIQSGTERLFAVKTNTY